MDIRNYIWVVTAFLWSGFVCAQDRKYSVNALPICAHLQYAGNMGIASVGAGTFLPNQKLYLGFVYGYLPKSVNDAEVHTIAIKAYYDFLSVPLSERITNSVYIGTNIIYGITRNTYLKYPDYYPEGYYSMNAIHLFPFIAGRMDFKQKSTVFRKIGVFCELGTVDSYIIDISRSKQVSVLDIFSLSSGITFMFEQKWSFR